MASTRASSWRLLGLALVVVGFGLVVAGGWIKGGETNGGLALALFVTGIILATLGEFLRRTNKVSNETGRSEGNDLMDDDRTSELRS